MVDLNSAPSPPKHLSSALAERPDLAAAIGMIIADYAALEILMCEIYAYLSPFSPAVAFDEFFNLRSINKRQELVVAQAQRLPDRYRRALTRLWRSFRGAAKRRTDVAHVHYMTGREGVMRVAFRKKQMILVPLSNDYINRTIIQYRMLGIDLLVFASHLVLALPGRARAIELEIDVLLRTQLQRHMAPQGPLSQLAASQRAAAERRLGLEGIRLGSRPRS